MSSYGYYLFCGDYRCDGATFSLTFLAQDWDEAETIAARLKLENVGKLRGLHPANKGVVEWATSKGVKQ